MKSSAAVAELNRVYNQSLNSPDYALQMGHEDPQRMPMPEMQGLCTGRHCKLHAADRTFNMLSLALQG